MKRFRLLVAAGLMTATLSLFIFVGMTSAAKVPHCTPHWHVASSATIYYNVFTLGQKHAKGGIGTVRLLRDGCGDVQGKISTKITTASLDIYLSDAHNNTIGVDSSNAGVTEVVTAIYHSYGHIAVSATGTIQQAEGDTAAISTSQTTPNSGA